MATEKKRDLVLTAKELQKTIDGCLKQAGEAQRADLLHARNLNTQLLLGLYEASYTEINAKLDRILVN